MNLKRKDTPESREHWEHAERVTREVEAEILQERRRGKCQCGQFDMPDDAMKIEARGYSVHARHKCSWGQRKVAQEEPTQANSAGLIERWRASAKQHRFVADSTPEDQVSSMVAHKRVVAHHFSAATLEACANDLEALSSSAPVERPRQCVIGEYCRRHQFIHGAEAEELRSKLEALIEQAGGEVNEHALRDLLDEVDARDSLAFIETRDPALCAECDGSVCECGHCECAHTFADDASGPGCTECNGCDGFEEAQTSPAPPSAAPPDTCDDLCMLPAPAEMPQPQWSEPIHGVTEETEPVDPLDVRKQLIVRWGADPSLQAAVPYRRMASDVAEVLGWKPSSSWADTAGYPEELAPRVAPTETQEERADESGAEVDDLRDGAEQLESDYRALNETSNQLAREVNALRHENAELKARLAQPSPEKPAPLTAEDEALIDKGWETLKAADIAAKGSPRDIIRAAFDPFHEARKEGEQ